jgi:hypothetical protein
MRTVTEEGAIYEEVLLAPGIGEGDVVNALKYD